MQYKTAIGHQTVPSDMIGCWRRDYIQYNTGESEPDSSVIYLQTQSGYADIRLSQACQNIAHLPLSHLSDPALLILAAQHCSCGITCVDTTATPYPTADWQRGEHGFAIQPVSHYPEPGWLQWRDNGQCMMENAPSGRYQEKWDLLASSKTPVAHLVRLDSTRREQLFICADHLVYAKDRPQQPTNKPLVDTLRELLKVDRNLAISYLDVEFSYATRTLQTDADSTTQTVKDKNHFTIQLSSVLTRVAQGIEMDWFFSTIGQPARSATMDTVMANHPTQLVDHYGHRWQLQSLAYTQ